MKLLLLGKPASGKGTIGELLSKRLGIPLVSIGELLRNMPTNHPRYQDVKDAMDRGELVPFDIPAQLLKERLSQSDCESGYIIDGWGRSLGNLSHFNPNLDKVLLFNISDETAIKRITGRRMCQETGEIFNIYTLPAEELKKCTGTLVQRDDDKEEVVKERLASFRDQTEPAIKYFKDEGLLVEIDAEPLPDVIFQNTLRVLNL